MSLILKELRFLLYMYILYIYFLKIPDPDHEVIEGAQDQVKNDQEVRRQDEERQLRHPKSFVYKS